MRKTTWFVVSIIAVLGLGWGASFGQTLDRGFADLAKRVMPGVVNIATFVRPRMLAPGSGGRLGPGGQEDLFRRFFEDFFGGRMPQPRGVPHGDEEDEEGETSIPDGKGAKSIPMALGTGFIIDEKEGLILTNHHVIQGAEEVRVQFQEEDSDLAVAEVIGRDPELDVALLKVKEKKLTALPLGNSDAMEVGEYVLAVGNPLGYGHTVSHGILSAKGRRNPEFKMGKYLQTDATINPGNSGGPLINMKGEVIGINNAIDARAQGIGFAIPINLVKQILTQLKTKGSVSRGFLGISVGDLTPELAGQMKLDSKQKGVIISDLTPGAPASEAGLKPYDVITSINGEKVTNAQDLTSKVTAIAVGEKAKIDFIREGKEKSVTVKVSERPIMGVAKAEKKEKPSKASQSTFGDFGFKVTEVNAQNSSQLGIPPDAMKGKKWLAVSDIEYGKAAANAGLSRGDVILDVAGQEVKSITELDRAFKNLKGKSVMIRVKRFDQAGNDYVNLIVLTQ